MKDMVSNRNKVEVRCEDALVTPSRHSCREKQRQSSAGLRKPIFSAIVRTTSWNTDNHMEMPDMMRRTPCFGALRLSARDKPHKRRQRCSNADNLEIGDIRAGEYTAEPTKLIV